ncbi:hypothetical protein I3843_08G022300 [Carya illinoinensis]|uniref:Uncharacterized protein n=1 Tax=Carya illinoinensis TaxID=32201 RepID=A0A8T1PRQ0_CARIL|nr:hypothetical protein I3760_08G022000 [Carya illinoinensis]KAG6643947.1 hypothetical protein CIPAW_08G021600 [Carya illinoinensis]KAG6698478.1 hypothetical protein I3842_08G021800 [Carya illinoinensis]KAG7965878.1 hypothetical protein I3843_08G022300 [Carya illinoinensis]
MAIMCMAPAKLNFLGVFPSSSSRTRSFLLKPAHCTPLQPVQPQIDAGIICELCNGKGWLLCDFCKGQKTNVKSKKNRIYRRCPSCRAIGYSLCSKCKVFKCVTFPNYSDDADLSS